jgi:arylsulfatase A-like enzyme
MSMNRREFLVQSSAVVGAWAIGSAISASNLPAPVVTRPNFLYILCDQMCLDAMSARDNSYVKTPNLDRLAERGVLFTESYSTYPVCSPARSSLLTGRMPAETGVVINNFPIRKSLPNLGEMLREQGGYDTVYCGKWHIPEYYAHAHLPGFRVLPAGDGEGHADDGWISRTCEAWLSNRSRNAHADAPFLLMASFMNPHDICYWALSPHLLVYSHAPYDFRNAELPPLPHNHAARPSSPHTKDAFYGEFDANQWRYYLYCYYRMIEELDHNVGRLLDALKTSRFANNTIVVFTSDHGENGGCHGMVQKDRQYESSMKVPLIWSCPGRFVSRHIDFTHLVSGMDVVHTICDYANVKMPPGMGHSLRPLLEARPVPWREFLVSEWQKDGRIVRTPQYKYVMFKDDPVEQLFDLTTDPWETVNLMENGKHELIAREHRRLLCEWNANMDHFHFT